MLITHREYHVCASPAQCSLTSESLLEPKSTRALGVATEGAVPLLEAGVVATCRGCL